VGWKRLQYAEEECDREEPNNKRNNYRGLNHRGAV
jgi:hypothetical protein